MKGDPRIHLIKTHLRAVRLLCDELESELAEYKNAPKGTMLKTGVPYGFYTRIAKETGCTPQHVRKVAEGLGTSKRISAAIEAARGAQ